MAESAQVPIPRTLEPPPRTTGNVQGDFPILLDWFYRAYQVISQSVAYINSQVNNASFSVANLPNPASTTLAQAQQTANDAYNLANTCKNRLDGFLHGTFSTSDADTGVVITFNTPQEDAEYRVLIQATAITGTPPTDALVIQEKAYTATQFSAIMAGTPGGGNSVAWEWQLIRNS